MQWCFNFRIFGIGQRRYSHGEDLRVAETGCAMESMQYSQNSKPEIISSSANDLSQSLLLLKYWLDSPLEVPASHFQDEIYSFPH